MPARTARALGGRRKAAETSQAGPRPAPAPSRKLGPLDRDLLEDLQRIERLERREAAAEAGTAVNASILERAGAVKRLAAAAIDALFLGGVSAAVAVGDLALV